MKNNNFGRKRKLNFFTTRKIQNNVISKTLEVLKSIDLENSPLPDDVITRQTVHDGISGSICTNIQRAVRVLENDEHDQYVKNIRKTEQYILKIALAARLSIRKGYERAAVCACDALVSSVYIRAGVYASPEAEQKRAAGIAEDAVKKMMNEIDKELKNVTSG